MHGKKLIIESPYSIWGSIRILIHGTGSVKIGKNFYAVSDRRRSTITLYSPCHLNVLDEGKIIINEHVGLNGTTIVSREKIEIGDACMIAHGAYISDDDWHGIYDRAEPVGKTKPIKFEDNVWIGDSAIICKGVTIGKNSIIGAGAVVTKDVPENCVFAGNPAKLVKKLDQGEFNTRKDFFKDPKKLAYDFDMLDRYSLQNNSFINWLKSIIFPDNTH